MLEQMDLSRRLYAHSSRRLQNILDVQPQGYSPVVARMFYLSKSIYNEPEPPQLFEN